MNLSSRILVLATLLVGGCASNSYCKGEQSYDNAPSVEPLKPVAGLTLPESASALKVPPPPPNRVPYGETYKDADGDDQIRCLDQPPEMPPPAAPKADTLAPAPGPAPAPAAPGPAPSDKPAEQKPGG